MERFVVLLRGINVGATRRVAMAELRAALAADGHEDVATYIQSGNIVLRAPDAATAETVVEAAVTKVAGFGAEAMARSGTALAGIAATNPFPDAVPKLLHLGLAKRPLAEGALARLVERARHGERIAVIGEAVWIDFADSGVAASKLSPAILDRAVGSTLTARNIVTVTKLVEMSTA